MRNDSLLGVITRELQGHSVVVSKVILIELEDGDTTGCRAESKLKDWANWYVDSFIKKFIEFKNAKWVLERRYAVTMEKELYDYTEPYTIYTYVDGSFIEEIE